VIPILTKSQAYQLDKSTFESGFSTQEELMDNAGFSIACYILENTPIPFNENILVIVGKGNNGGDGIITHHYLIKWGCNSKLMFIDENIESSSLIKKYNISKNSYLIYNSTMEFTKYDLIIDGILGIGISRNLDEKMTEIINKVNSCENIFSIDIPSGLFCDSGNIKENSILARQTHTMGYPKLGQFINNGLNSVGFLQIHDIGFPEFSPVIYSLIEEEDIVSKLKQPDADCHKYSKGKLVVIGGSIEYIGALELASNAGYRSGAGYVKALVPSEIKNIINEKNSELIVNSISKQNIEKEVEWGDAFVIGPGLNIELVDLRFILNLIKMSDKPVVIDATALNFIDSGIFIDDFPNRAIFTPHKGELKYLSHNIKRNFSIEPIEFMDELIENIGERCCLIKGQPNFIVNPDGTINLMNHGTPTLSTAGTGDVLSGLIGGLLSQGYTEQNAMIVGSWIHAESALIFAENFGSIGMIATDLLEFIPSAFEKYLVN
jgi:ADP-dependent NAD(P)H-hydrate dehydratase / NAD(P)H-hydrate epimerase